MMRYMTSLQHKDLFLTITMISLGSCTMKLNSVASLAPCSWPEVMNIHPFASASNTTGYREMLNSLEAYLVSCTGFDACSLQPNSGASGEYAGQLVIRKYQESIWQGHRNVCIIPRSAHGTNPASAVMCGMKIKWIDDSQGVAARRTQEDQAGDRRCEGEQAQRCGHRRHLRVEWLAEHRHRN